MSLPYWTKTMPFKPVLISCSFRNCQRHFLTVFVLGALIFIIGPVATAQADPENQAASEPLQELKDSGLLTEFGQLLAKIKRGVTFPQPRTESRLLPLLPESTVFYAAVPNYGDAAHQAFAIFKEELQQSPALRSWWNKGDMKTTGPKLEDAINRFYLLSQFLGDEVVLSGSNGSRSDPDVLLVAEIRKPGLKTFLEQAAKELGIKPETSLRIFDPQQLAAAKDTHPTQTQVFFVLVRSDFLVASTDLAVLRRFNEQLDRKSREFTSAAFGQRLGQTYENGASIVAGVDLEKIMRDAKKQTTSPEDKSFQLTGFGDVKYLIWEHKTVGGQQFSQMELSFTGPRHGMASWLAGPKRMGSLEFISPKALAVVALQLKNPADMFDEARLLAAGTRSSASFAQIDQMEKIFHLSLKDDLLGQLDGEIAIDIDSLTAPHPAWSVILKVKDEKRLQATLATLLTAMNMRPIPSECGEIACQTIRIPAGPNPLKISYSVVDGYLLITSSPEVLAGSIRIHESHDSLARSEKFVSSLPEGSALKASAILYENPLKMAAASMKGTSPELAGFLSETGSETAAPLVMSFYGEEKALREVTRGEGLDAGILIGAAIAIPNLLRARIAANESAAVGMLRTVNVAQISYAAGYASGYARDLATLGPGSGSAGDSAKYAGFIDETLGNRACTNGAWCTKSGYRFSMTTVCKKGNCQSYTVVATPVSSGTGTRNFCSSSDAVIRFKMGPPLTEPISPAECKMWAPLN